MAHPNTRAVRRLMSTDDFTLREHCGGFSSELGECLTRHNLPKDPMTMDEASWTLAPECRLLWRRYRECGREFLATVRSVRCKEEVARLSECTSNCEEYEMEALKCLGKKIRLRMTMSGKRFESTDNER